MLPRKFNSTDIKGVEESLVDLLPRLKCDLSVHDDTAQVVERGLHAEPNEIELRLNAIGILRNSINAHYGNQTQYDPTIKVLDRQSLDTILTLEALECHIIKHLLQNTYPQSIVEECIKLLSSIALYMPREQYKGLFNHAMQRFLLSVIIDASNNIRAKHTSWVYALTIFTNLLNSYEVPLDLVNQLSSCVTTIADEASVSICHTIITRVILPRLATSAGVEHEQDCRMCKRLVLYLYTILSNSEEKPLITLALLGLTAVCEHKSGIEIVLDSCSLNVILRLALVVVERYDQINRTLNRFTSNEEILKSITSQLHDLSFDSLSVLSKMAYTANRMQIGKIIDSGALDVLVKVLECPVSSERVKTRSCNTLGNIACETDLQVQAIIDADALPILIRLFKEEQEHDTRVEAAYAICSCLSKANQKQVGYILSATSKCNHIGDGLCMLMIGKMLDFVCKSDPGNSGNIKLCKIVLCAIDNLLNTGVHEQAVYKLTENPYCKMFMDIGGETKLAKIGFFPDCQIAMKSMEILHRYFNVSRFWSQV
ncbi:bifunctional Armadillo/Armadillo-type fold/Armadillo-like helical [Babesia duncani]|uniref:Bifunctional Armadillo/Armadillo-type fold/Armadillo-like helical n=1 Tax=Babesia duncani TaxID=323732 RepID=A0AAD9PPD9_9APIC|nr:bifunctional Armadillo/Armadillo-type fold/Armadillo-like helical [Babesia duncani]KAK2198182.1 bifunctional Armadillo/Armadillo-type fold/Armadillo-like helical [Babesia duncani]